MNEKPQIPAPRRKRKTWQAMMGLFLLAGAIWAAWFFTSSGFRNFVRGRIESKIFDATGGRAEIRDLQWNLSKMEFDLRDVTLHGLEAPSEKPFVHVDRVFARIEVISFFHQQVNLEFLGVTHPVVHLIVYPDGTTNQPQPKSKSSERNPADQLVDLAVGKLDLQQAELILNQQTVPIAFEANDVVFNTSFDKTQKRYDGTLHIGKVEGKIGGWRPLATTADLDFNLYRDRALIRRFALTTGKSKLEASGSLDDLSQLRATLIYKARVSVPELAAAARLRDLTAGVLELQGNAQLAMRGSATSGTVKFRDLGYSDGNVRITGMNGQSNYAIDRNKMTYSAITASALSGTVEGKGEIQNWSNVANQVGSMTFRVAGVQLTQLAEAASTKKLPLTELHFGGLAGGTVDLTWKGPFADSRTKLDVFAVPPSQVPDGQLPVRASLVGTFFHRAQTLQIDKASLSTPASTITGHGAFNVDHAQLDVSLHSSRSAEFRSIVAAMRAPDPTPIELNGPAVFEGTISGRLATPIIFGHLELRDFVTKMPPDATSPATQLAPIHWDSLITGLRYTPDQLSLSRASITRGRAQANLDLAASLHNGTFTDATFFTIRANVRGADLTDLQSAFGYNYPASGKLDLVVQATGTRANLKGGGHLQLSNAVLYSEPGCNVVSDFQFNGPEVVVPSFHARNASGEVTATGSYNVQSTAFRFEAKSGTVELGKVQLLRQKRIDVQGSASFEATGFGSEKEPNIAAKLHFRDLVFSGERAGALEIDALTQGENMKLNAVSDFQNASVQLDGNIRLRDNLPAHLVLTFNNLDIDPLLSAYLRQFRTTSHTLMAGKFEMNGPLREPKKLEAKGSIDSFVAGIENVKIASKGPILLSLKNQAVSLDALHLVGEGTDFSATGRADLFNDRAIDVRVDGRINMRILQSFSPEYTSSGLTTINLNVRGTWQQPRMRGRIQITDGAISYVDLPNGLSGINGTMIFTEDRLQVQKLSARTGGGDLDIGGFIAYSNGLTFTLTAHGKEIRLRYPPGVSATGDADLTLAGTPKNSLLSGEITVTRFGLNPKFDFASYIAKSKQSQLPIAQDSPVNSLRLDIHVVSTPELQLETSLAKVTGNIDLHVRGTAARPVLLGRLNIFEGDIVFNSTTYHLERGEITFNNPAQIQPVLDVEASAHVRDYDITLGFHGPAERPSISYRSDPPLPTADIIALLALGRTRQDSAAAQMYNPQQTTLSESDENALLGQALNATVSSRVQRLFGVSRIKIDPQVGGPDNNANARLTIEQQVSNKITITYITNLSQSAQQIIQLEWNITRDLSLQGSRDQTGVLGFDVKIRQRKK